MLEQMFTDSPIELLLYVRKGRPENYYSELFFEFWKVITSTDDIEEVIGHQIKSFTNRGSVQILHINSELKYAIVTVNIREMAGF